MFLIYVLWSDKVHRYYIGSSQELENRMKEHNSGETRSLRSGMQWKVIHIEQFATRAEAIRKEKQIKARGAKRYLEGIKKAG